MIIETEYGEDVELCDCECEQEIIHTDVHHEKRNRYWIEYTLVCLRCEMGWIEKLYCTAQGREIVITQQATHDPNQD